MPLTISKKKLTYPVGAMLMAGILLISGCGHGDAPKWRIGVSQPCDDEWRHKQNEEIRREAMFHPDVEVTFTNADNRSGRQVEQIEALVDSGIDLLIVAPNEARQVTPAIEKAYKAGIPVITFDRNIYGDSYTAHFEPDNKGIGRQAALYARHLIPSGPINALEIRGLDHSTPAQQRHEGFAGMADSISDFHIISVSADWNAARSAALADSLLRHHPDINLIFAHNDHMAMAASEVVKKRGRDDIHILGIDAVPGVGLSAVAEGKIDATFIYPTEGGLLLDKALRILEGKEFSREEIMGSLSSVDHSNADILQRQYDLITSETDKVEFLLDAHRRLGDAHRIQTRNVYLLAIFLIILGALMAILLTVMRQRRKLERKLEEKNSLLEEEKKKQEMLYSQLDEATRSKLQFYTNVSHDLRTPLTLIATPVERVARAPYLNPDDRMLMQMAVKNIAILRRLIDQLLDFRKYENGKLALRKREMDFEMEAREWIENFRAAALARDITLSASFSNPGHVTLAADPAQLERIVFNLLSNAFRYTPDNGRILFESRLDDDRLTFSVTDNGPGIPEEALDRVFDRFYQLDDSNSAGGSGIGLSVSRAIARLHGGDISVESRRGGPTCFTVSLPVTHIGPDSATLPAGNADADPSSPSEANGIATPTPQPQAELNFAESSDLDSLNDITLQQEGNKPLLLVIDDNRDLILMLRSLLSDIFNVIGSDSGLKGITLAMRYVPDIIICDLYMPGTDGLEVCRVLKSETATSHIPILIITANPDDEKRLESYDSGANAFLAKPFDRKILRARLTGMLENRRRISYHARISPEDPNPSEAEGRHDSSERRDQISSDFYKEVITAINKNLSDPDLTIDRIAAGLGLSQGQLARKLKALTNYSPVELLRKLRLSEARRLMLSTDKSISEITYLVGFSSPAYFSRCFREAYNISPRDFRNSIGSHRDEKGE